MTTGSPPLRVGLFMSLALGHRTQYLNWRRVIDAQPGSLLPTWVPIESAALSPGGLSLIPDNLRRTVREWQQLRDGFRRGPFDAVMLNPHGMAMKHQAALARQPHFLALDATRRQFNSLSRWYRPAPSETGLLGSLRVRRQRKALQAATGFFPVSKWAAASLVDDYGVDPARIHLTPLGVDPGLWKPPEKKTADGIVRILFVGGRFEPKGGELLLRWAKTTARKNWELHLVTRDPPTAAAANIFFHQADNNSVELISLAQRCDLFALPTLADCSSLAALEAMSAGLPALITGIGGIPELVREGETGHLIEPDNFDQLHERLEAMLDSPDRLAAMGRAARARVLVEFNAQINVRRALTVMEAACKNLVSN